MILQEEELVYTLTVFVVVPLALPMVNVIRNVQQGSADNNVHLLMDVDCRLYFSFLVAGIRDFVGAH